MCLVARLSEWVTARQLTFLFTTFLPVRVEHGSEAAWLSLQREMTLTFERHLGEFVKRELEREKETERERGREKEGEGDTTKRERKGVHGQKDKKVVFNNYFL